MKILKNYFKIFKKYQAEPQDNHDILIKEKYPQKVEAPSVRFAQWQADTLQKQQSSQENLSKIYSPYKAPPGVRGKISSHSSHKIVMDSALSTMPGFADWAGENISSQNILKSAFEDGLVFLGYPTLAEMANRPELRKPCHVIAREALREWISIQTTNSDAGGNAQSRVKEMEQELLRLNVRSLLQKMAEQSLLYGVAHLWIAIEGDLLNSDGQSIPLAHTANGLAKDSLKELRLIEPIWMTPNSYRADNPLCPDYYRPEHWWVQGILVHHSRLLQMVPYEVSDLLKPAFNFGGLSLTQQLKPYAHNYLRIRNSVANIVANFSKLVLQTDMSANMSANDEDMFGGMIDASGLTGRAKLLQALSEGQDTIIADKENEDIKIISTPLGGLDALQAQSQEAQAAIPGIPLVKLFGVTPKGLNASSEGEIRVFYDEIKSFQQANLRPILEKIFRLCQLNLWGEIDPSLSFEFLPLWQLDPQEKTALEKSKADIDALNIKNNIITPNEARERQQGEKGSIYGSINLSKPLLAPADPDTHKNEKEAPQNSPAPQTAQDAEWDESKHPRNPKGEFTEKGQGYIGAATNATQNILRNLTSGAGEVLHALNPIGTAEAAPARPSRSMELENKLAEERAKIADPLSDEKAVSHLMTVLQKQPRLNGKDLPDFLDKAATLKGAPGKEKISNWLREWGNGWIQSNDPLFTPKELTHFQDKDHLSSEEKQADLHQKMQDFLKEIWSDPRNRMTQDPNGNISAVRGGKGDEKAAIDLMKDGHKASFLGKLENGMDVFTTTGFQRYFENENGRMRKKGLGLAHMEASHGEQFKALGFKSAEDYAKYVFEHADKKFYDPEKGNMMLVLSKQNSANPTFGKTAQDGASIAENLNLILQTSREGKQLLVRSGFPMGVNNNEVERKEADRPEIEERMSRVKDIADDLEKIKDPEQRRAYLSAAQHFFHDAPASATITNPAHPQPYQKRPAGQIFGAEGLANLHNNLKNYLAKEAQNDARHRNAETGQEGQANGTQVMGVSVSPTPAEQEHVFGAYADPKALKNRQNEIIQNGGVKAGFGKAEEAPKIPARHSTQEMEQHYAAPENSAQQSGQKMEGEIPSANISQTENTQRTLYLNENTEAVQENKKNSITLKNNEIQNKDFNVSKRPDWIPDSWQEKPSKKGKGMRYYNPKNEHDHVRIMEGEPNCTLPFRQKPYVKYSKQGTYVDKNGNPVHSGSPDAHIPYKEFKYDKKTD
ncbi:DUF1073 domain-containing protein [Acetobacteraceae bacterium]|nr:DUF1073 domain-containing protein [Acetobacteraceae bacterium]